MSRAIFDLVMGSNEPVDVQLYPVASDTGSNGIDLTGATAFSAKAKHEDTGGTASFSGCTALSPLTAGKVRLTYLTTTFGSTGVWNVQITFTDSTGSVRRYPSDGTGLRFRVHAAN